MEETIQYVAIITINQKDSLMGELVCPDVYFNPTMDVNEQWFISDDEINTSIYPQHEWIKDLTLSVYAGPYIPPPTPSGDTMSISGEITP
jgi:hypothetical protein